MITHSVCVSQILTRVSASADYIADHKLASKVAVIYNSSDPYSSGIYQKFAAEAKAKGLDVVAAEAFHS